MMKRAARAAVLALGLGLVLSLGVAACAQQAAPTGATGEPMERLTLVTATGAHDFWVEIADEEPERQRGLMFVKNDAFERAYAMLTGKPAEDAGS